jgi:hypothetical protein
MDIPKNILEFEKIEGGFFIDDLTEEEQKFVLGKKCYWFDDVKDMWFIEESCSGAKDRLYHYTKPDYWNL